MQTEIVVALIGVGGSAFGGLIGVLINSKLMTYRLEQLEKKVDKHNNLIERTYKLEEAQAVLEQQMKVEQHRMDDAEAAIEKNREKMINLTRRN